MFNNRYLIPQLPCALIIGLWCILSISHSQSIYDPQSNTYVIGLNAAYLDVIEVAEETKQQKKLWCWAATSQALLATQGIDVAQSTIVNRIIRGLDLPAGHDAPNTAATAEQVRLAADGHHDIINNRSVFTQARFISPHDVESIVRNLSQGIPLITGFSNHVYLMTAAEYKYNASGQKELLQVVLRDPWPDNESRQQIQYHDYTSHQPILIEVAFIGR